MTLAAEHRFIERACDGGTRTAPLTPVHELAEQQALRAPDAVALRFRDDVLTYGELNRRANRVAHELLGRGVGGGCRVVVCVEPSFDVVVALLGVLKAGAAYVPLDPSYPAARLGAILDDTRPELVLTQTPLLERLELGDAPRIALDVLAADDGERWENPAVDLEADQLATVFYTSGTTGTPKGVMASHANLFHYVSSAVERYAIGPADVIPAVARFSFSISLFELLTPLVAGASLVVLEREHVLDAARLAGTLEHVTVIHAGPSLWKGLIRQLGRKATSLDAFARVRHVSSGGDMVPPELLEALKEIFRNAEVFVIYGCSEISCMGTTYPVPRDRRVTTTLVGRPFEDVTLRVLDASNKVVPVGVVGEIHFAGSGVTLGYLNRPALTSEQFLTLEGRRFYRTGDRGRLHHDGTLEILGRNDSQVKIRGMRVELAEVDLELRRAPGVRDGVTTAKPTPDGEKMLVAYVVPESAGDGPAERAGRLAAVRRHLLARLPDYAVPSVYVELERLPLNHNSKLDRRALPEPSEADLRALSNPSLRAPNSATERTLATLFRRHLGLSEVGLDDNFFELGGHSLSAQELCVAAEAELGVRLEGIELLREPLEILAQVCDRRLGHAPAALDLRPRAALPEEAVELFHFGADRSLYGVLHGTPSGATQAVLLCGPLGQEQVRSRFVLTRLAKALAREGTPALYFDYFGCGDSLGDAAEAGAGRWQADIRAAYAELVRRTGATRVTAVGVRLGALLLCDAALSLELGKLVLWDPVCDGREHFVELRAMQRRFLKSTADLWFWDLAAERPPANELLGTHYSDAIVRELTSLSLPRLLAERRVPTRWLATLQLEHEAGLLRGLGVPGDCRAECLDLDCGWHDVAELEDVIPDVGLSKTLAKMVLEAP
jgi:amino acid adenylation domain-containing protein